MAREPGPRLGRGLASLLGDEPSAIEAPATHMLALDALEPGPFQPRRQMEPSTLVELKESIRAHGILQPLLLRPHPSQDGRFQIIAGERRWRAAREAGLSAVPALVLKMTDADAMAASLVENLQRADLNPIEEAEGYRRLIDEFGLTQEKLGEAVGKSRSHIANVLRLLGLPESVRAAVQDGRLTAGHARALLAHANPEAIASVVMARGLNVRQTEALASGREDRTSPAEALAKDPEMDALEQDMSEKLGLRVSISFNGQSGRVLIAYQTLDQLDGLIALLGRTS